MKKIFLSLGILAGLFLTSCDDGLLENFTPGTINEDEGILDDTDLQRVMNTVYTSLTPLSEMEFDSVFTDEVAIGFANGGQGLGQDYVFNVNSDGDAANDIWVSHYVTIGTANRVIKGADALLATDEFATSTNVKRLKAEALTVRAYCHNQLMSYYSTNPKNPSALGVLIAIDVYPYTYTSLRKTNLEVFTQIDSDLDAAIALFAESGATVDRLAANVDFAHATKARSYALRGDYPNALIEANWVIDNSGLQLATFANYRLVFHTDAQPANQEVIFKVKKTAGQTRVGAIYASVAPTVAGSPFFEVSRSLFNLLPTSDVRRTTNVLPASEIDETAYQTDPNYNTDTEKIIIRKHPGRGTGSTTVFVNDIKISRLSEMYLIRAEAYADANDLVNAATNVRTIRAIRRNVTVPTLVFADQQEAWREILQERRVEFCYEGYRYIDLKRLGALAGVTINRDPKDCTQFNACNVPAMTDYRFTLPIPTAESNANSAILSQQNPGY